MRLGRTSIRRHPPQDAGVGTKKLGTLDNLVDLARGGEPREISQLLDECSLIRLEELVMSLTVRTPGGEFRGEIDHAGNTERRPLGRTPNKRYTPSKHHTHRKITARSLLTASQSTHLLRCQRHGCVCAFFSIQTPIVKARGHIHTESNHHRLPLSGTLQSLPSLLILKSSPCA